MITAPTMSINKAIVLRRLGVLRDDSFFLAMNDHTAPARYSTKAIANKVTRKVLIYVKVLNDCVCLQEGVDGGGTEG